VKNILGAQRPASTRKVLWIAVAAIVLVVTLATAAFSEAYGDNWFGMGPDNVMGMMPPSMGMSQPPGQPAVRYAADSGVSRASVANCSASANITIKQTDSHHHHTFTYVSMKNGCVYTIWRDRTPWATVTYDAGTGTYKLTDPNGSGELLLELGIKPGQFPGGRVRPGTIKVIRPTSSAH
jgi:hypothetical protein